MYNILVHSICMGHISSKPGIYIYIYMPCGAIVAPNGWICVRKHPFILIFQWPCTPKPKHKKQRASMHVEMDTTVFSTTFKLAGAYWYTSYTYTRQQSLQCFFLGLPRSKPNVSK